MTQHAKLSASGSHRWLNCPGSVEAEAGLPDNSSRHADEGTAAHALAEYCLLKSASPDALIGQSFEGIEVTQEMADAVQMYINYVRFFSGQHFYEVRVDFSPWVPDGFGTSDAIVIQPRENTLRVIDLKYGKGVKVDAENNTQGMLYALGALNEYGHFCDIKKVVISIVQPRIDHISEWELTIDRLLEFGDIASKTAKQALQPNAIRVPGEKQCMWCKAKAVCPALKSHAEQTVMAEFDNLDANTLPAVDTLTDEQLRQALQAKKLINGWLDAVEQHVTAKLNNGETFDGYKLVEGRSSRQWRDEETAYKVLSSEFDDDDLFSRKFISVAQAEKLIGKKRAKELSDLVEKPQGKPTLVPDSDKRPPIGINPDDFDCMA